LALNSNHEFYENSSANLPYSRTFYHNCRIGFSFETACKAMFYVFVVVSFIFFDILIFIAGASDEQILANIRQKMQLSNHHWLRQAGYSSCASTSNAVFVRQTLCYINMWALLQQSQMRNLRSH
jgi:hypothetical protein